MSKLKKTSVDSMGRLIGLHVHTYIYIRNGIGLSPQCIRVYFYA